MEDKNSKGDGSFGIFPGTHGDVSSFKYNGLSIALSSNHPGAAAGHDRAPQETISPIESRDITGPFAQPYGESRVKGKGGF